jgi:hypothetical protein
MLRLPEDCFGGRMASYETDILILCKPILRLVGGTYLVRSGMMDP